MKEKSNRDLEVKIPKILLRTWKTNKREDLPEGWLKSHDSAYEFLKGWKIVFFGHDGMFKYVKKNFPDFYDYYVNLDYDIQRADAFRYMWLYINGGLYSDMDHEFLHSIDDLFIEDHDIYMLKSPNVKSVYANSFMGSKPKHPVWLKMIEHMKYPSPFWAVGAHLKVMNRTGSYALSYVLRNYEGELDCHIIPEELCLPCNLCELETCDTSRALVKQVEGSSWHRFDSMMYNKIFCSWKHSDEDGTVIILAIVVTFLILIIIALFLYIISRYTKN